MASSDHPTLIAVDVGNQRMKFGRFDRQSTQRFPEPDNTLQIADDALDMEPLARWLGDLAAHETSWVIGTVNRPATTRLLDWLSAQGTPCRVTLLAAGDLPLSVAVERPDMVGIDRLLDAVAANCLRAPHRPAVVVDVGTAITVDLLSTDGVFLGGAIAPGIAMSARAFHEFTDLLPLIGMSELTSPPPALGTSTIEAMRSGLFWGAVGAARQLIECLAAEVSGDPEVFLTGGAGPAVAKLLGRPARHVPHLTLAGIALTTAETG